MNRKRTAVRCALLAAYAVPYSFLSAWGDAVHGSLLFGGLLIVALVILCIVSLKTENASIMFIGCGLTCISSLLMAKICGLNEWNWYFKPFSAYSLIIAYVIIQLFIQTIICIIHYKRKLP